jgi:4-coumarate--CoA ligase
LVLFALYTGIEIIVLAKFDLEKFCAITERKRVTFASVVPPILLLLGKSPVVDKYDLTSLRMLSSGAAPLTKELVQAVRGRLNIPIMQGYGLSETSPMTHNQVSSSYPWLRHIGSPMLMFYPGMGGRWRTNRLHRPSPR